MRTEPKRQGQEKLHNQRKRRAMLWALILVLLLLMSSCGLMYHLGKRAQDQAEPNRQTIKVEEEKETKTTLSIYGIVSYTDGTPCADHTIELHSSPQTTQTGSDGSFFFYDVERGEHILTVLDSDGREKASLNFNISEHEDKTLQYVDVSSANQKLLFEIPVNTLLLDVDVELDETVHTLSIGSVTAGLTEGRVLTAVGSVQAKDGEAVVFASGHYMLPDGTIVLANGGILFTEPFYLPPDAAGDILPEGVTIDENGVIQLPDETRIDRQQQQIILPNGIILNPDFTAKLPDDSTLSIPDYGDNAYLIREKDSGLIGSNGVGSKNIGIVRDDQKQEIEAGQSQSSQENAEGQHLDSEYAQSGGSRPGRGNSDQTGTSAGPENPENGGSVPANPGEPENPLETSPAETSGVVNGSGNSTGGSGGGSSSGGSGSTKPTEEAEAVEIGDRKTGKLWKQMAAIDLFCSPDGSRIYEKLYPGIEGQYDFYIRNTMKEVTYMTVTMEEEANTRNGGTLPLEYQILDGNGNVISGDWKDAAALKQFPVTLQPKENVNYSIRWRWPYETTDASGSVTAGDTYDTKLATSEDLSHKLKLVIHIEQ